MNECNLKVIESVINITEERDKKSLETSLIDTLSTLIDCKALILLNVTDNHASEYVEISISSPKDAYISKYSILSIDEGCPHVKRDPSIIQCLTKSTPILDDINTTSRALFPIISDEKIERIIDIHEYKPTENSLKIIEGIISIYSNFLSVLHDNEHDTLTGLLNRKSFDKKFYGLLHNTNTESLYDLPEEVERRKVNATNEPWLAVLDIDHFKKVNDTFGHIYGDEVLLLFANILKTTFRSNDLIFRFGGEEFIVIISNTTEDETFTILERFRKKVEDYDFPQVGKVTVSIGIVKTDTITPPVTLIEKADQALYFAKDNGRNQTRNYHELISSGELEEKETKDDIELF